MNVYTFLFFILFSMYACTSNESNLTHAKNDLYLVTVNGSHLSLQEAEKQLLSHENKYMTMEGVISQWVKEELLFQEAVKLGLEKDQTLNRQVESFRRRLFGNTFLEKMASEKTNVNLPAITLYYEQHQDEFLRNNQEAKIYHFILASEKEALNVKRTLVNVQSGGKRKALFTTYRVDAVVVRKNALIPALEKAIFSQSSNLIRGPIKTQSGYHVIEILKQYNSGTTRGLDEVYDEIFQRLLQEQIMINSLSTLDSLQKNAHIEINSELLK